MKRLVVAVFLAALFAQILPATAHIPAHCIPANLEETVEQKSSLATRITSAADNNRLLELLDSVAIFMQVDGRLSQMIGSMLTCSVR
ncbi:MAG: hypothetical protein OXI57_11150 [Rhodospirillales bacterium]|nr:hypothetical protein [Rhodospirillales bacterium]